MRRTSCQTLPHITLIFRLSSEKDLKNEFHISYKGLRRGDGGVIQPLLHRPACQTPYQTLSVSHVHTPLPVVDPLLHRPA